MCFLVTVHLTTHDGALAYVEAAVTVLYVNFSSMAVIPGCRD